MNLTQASERSCLMVMLVALGAACTAQPPAEPSPSVGDPAPADEAHTPDSDAAGGTRLADGETPAGSEQPKGEAGSACGGIAGLACEEGLFCMYALDAQCGAADQMGTCTRPPEACTMEYNPVCGCDDATHSNLCSAHAKGVSAASKGECNPE